MNLTHLRQSIGDLRARIFGLAPAELQDGRQEIEELAIAISEYGRMRQEHYGSRSVLLGAGELAMRLRETTPTIVKALGVLRDQGCAEETGTRGRWRLLLHRARRTGDVQSIGGHLKARRTASLTK